MSDRTRENMIAEADDRDSERLKFMMTKVATLFEKMEKLDETTAHNTAHIAGEMIMMKKALEVQGLLIKKLIEMRVQ